MVILGITLSPSMSTHYVYLIPAGLCPDCRPATVGVRRVQRRPLEQTQSIAGHELYYCNGRIGVESALTCHPHRLSSPPSQSQPIDPALTSRIYLYTNQPIESSGSVQSLIRNSMAPRRQSKRGAVHHRSIVQGSKGLTINGGTYANGDASMTTQYNLLVINVNGSPSLIMIWRSGNLPNRTPDGRDDTQDRERCTFCCDEE
ncbi:hypothetical protein BKA70DRAFT_1404010 [Coprinopsis sp. MPI-PUGE-AT-0042]|nr:hypothetical protein BKA70DRAFT_1404010 [Coprinopsis sp. MPI-PUGE-AT-0042]